MIDELFRDRNTIQKIRARLPELFQIAELESSRAGKIGMEVGSMRERIIIALLIHRFGEKYVKTDLPIHEPEVDVIVDEMPISIKTITGKRIGGVKLIWTVDREQAIRFGNEYIPTCDMLLVHINWDGEGGLYLFSKDLQSQVLNQMGPSVYLTLPKPGTNPRGVEMSKGAIRLLSTHPQSLVIPVHWEKKEISFDPFERWLELWK